MFANGPWRCIKVTSTTRLLSLKLRACNLLLTVLREICFPNIFQKILFIFEAIGVVARSCSPPPLYDVDTVDVQFTAVCDTYNRMETSF